MTGQQVSARELVDRPELRILVADDNQATVWLWARILREFGAEVVGVFDGETAISRVASEHFDLVITDLQMPGASGLEVLRRAKEHDEHVPVILSTGHAPNHVVAEASRLGVCEILLKPFDFYQAAGLARDALGTRAGPRVVH